MRYRFGWRVKEEKEKEETGTGHLSKNSNYKKKYDYHITVGHERVEKKENYKK